VLSRRELALVAAALLLPVPLLTQTGLNLPLPNALERGLGALLTLDSEDERSGARATTGPSEIAPRDGGSAAAALAVTPAESAPTASEASSTKRDRAASSQPDEDGGDADDTPASDEPKGGGDTHDPGPPGTPGGPDTPARDGGGGSHAETGSGTGVSLSVASPGAATGVSVGAGGVTLEVTADSLSTEDEGAVGAAVETGDATGSVTLTGANAPPPGALLP